MAQTNLEKITLDSLEYQQLGLNDQIHVFNRQVHAFEIEQEEQIKELWQVINADYIKPGKLSEDKVFLLKHSFAQAQENLKGMMEAKTLYEANLYRESYLVALGRVKAPSRRRRFIMLQSDAIGLAHNAKDVQARLASVKKELTALKTQYDAEHQDLFGRAERELNELAQEQDSMMFTHKRKQFLNTLADIHETANAMSQVDRECDQHIEEAMDRGKALFTARSSYLEDKNSWMNRAADIAEKGWVGLGLGLAAVPVALAIAVPALIGGAILAPVVALGLGITGAAYGAVDLSRTTASLITKETTPTLGGKPFAKPKPSRWQKFKNLAKKAGPVTLCVMGAAIAVAAVVVTAGVAGIVLAGAGLVVASIGAGMMVKDKYDERKEVLEIRDKHKELNERFEAELKDADNKNTPKPTPEPENKLRNSTEESMDLLSGHELTETNVMEMQEQLLQEQQTQDAVEDAASKLANTPVVSETSESETEIKTQSATSEDDEDEGGGESDSDSEKESDDAPVLKP